MADFVKFIDENQCLSEYFTKFPKQLMELILEVIKLCNDIHQSIINIITIFFKQGKIAKFSGKAVIVNYNLLQKHLMSPDSEFEIQTLQDFLETLHILGFNRGWFPEKMETQICYRFINPHFLPNTPIPDDLYKLPVDLTSKALKNTKRMLSSHSIHLLQRLMQEKSRQELKISKLELAQLRLNFALQKQQNLMRTDRIIIEYVTEAPEYTKSNEIAGFYGNVSLDALKFGFQNYFPTYHEAKSEPSSQHQQPIQMEETPIIADAPFKIEILPCSPSLQSDEPPKKKRRYTKKSSAILKETREAILHLNQEEMMEIPREE